MVRRNTIRTLHSMQGKEKIAALTCYDASFAAVLDAAGVDLILVGDSLGMVIQGQETTLAVSAEDVLYHAKSVLRGSQRAMVMADMPFATYHADLGQAFTQAARFLQAGVQIVKLEGGHWLIEVIAHLSSRGIPVCAHLGLLPQCVHKYGGYRVQGATEAEAQRLYEEALALQEAGASMILLEMVPATLAQRITEALTIPTIGIGAGPACSGQVLVLYDILGLSALARLPRFVKNYLLNEHPEEGRDAIRAAVQTYVQEVKAAKFPALEHTY